MSDWSVRKRLFAVIVGMALIASVSIGAVYFATEGERGNLRADRETLARLHRLTVDLAAEIHAQKGAVDLYLVSGSDGALAAYRAATVEETRIAEGMRLDALEHPGVLAALADVAGQTQAWRSAQAEPAIATASRGASTGPVISGPIVPDPGSTLDGVRTLANRLDEAEGGLALRDESLRRTRASAGAFGILLLLLTATGSLILTRNWITRPIIRLLATARDVEKGADTPFHSERDDEIGRLGGALERMRSAVQSDVNRSRILNRFTEVTTYAADDAAVAAAHLEALRLLVAPDAAVSHVLNRSKDRAIPEASIGGAIAEVLPLRALSRCPSIVRGSIYVAGDASELLSVHCPVYEVDHGTLACVPLAHGEVVGALHLYWERPYAFALEDRSSVARLAYYAALAIGNRRLLAALESVASTDPRTGLANSATFDQALEDALASRTAAEEVAVLMLDLDHFKSFNDRYGHPSGDEALRTFAKILRSCLRDGDMAARYGGEEFAVTLPNVDQATAFAVAERIRSRTEATIISLAPGITDRITVSIGVAFAPRDADERLALLRLADDALYRAKEAGRNRVVAAGGDARLGGAAAESGAHRPPSGIVDRLPARDVSRPAIVSG